MVQLTTSMSGAFKLSELRYVVSSMSTSPGSTSLALESSVQNSVLSPQVATGQSFSDFGRVVSRVDQGLDKAFPSCVDRDGPMRDELRVWDDTARASLLSYLESQPITTESRATVAALQATPLRSEAPFMVLAEEYGTTPPRKSHVAMFGFKCPSCLTLEYRRSG